jgi:hypothetical protein
MVLLSLLQDVVQEYFVFTRAQGYGKALEKSILEDSMIEIIEAPRGGSIVV